MLRTPLAIPDWRAGAAALFGGESIKPDIRHSQGSKKQSRMIFDGGARASAAAAAVMPPMVTGRAPIESASRPANGGRPW